jgi:neutral ceramidase
MGLAPSRNGENPGQDGASLRAGAAAVDISPQQFPLNMPGGFSANMAEGVHDPLHARALVLDDGATVLALVVVDNLGVAREVADEARAIIAERCGIAPEKVLVARRIRTALRNRTTEGRNRRWRTANC